MIGMTIHKGDKDLYKKAADWCNETQAGHIEFDGNDCFIVVENKKDERMADILEKGTLEDWFIWYDRQVAQYNRCQRLGTEFDGDIKALDEQAIEKSARLRKLNARIQSN